MVAVVAVGDLEGGGAAGEGVGREDEGAVEEGVVEEGLDRRACGRHVVKQDGRGGVVWHPGSWRVG